MRVSPRRTTTREVLAWSGLAGALIGFATTLLASAVSPTFAWAGSALSDLGAPGATTAWLFNGGLVLAGVVALPFGWILFASARHVLERVGAVAYTGSVASLALVGAFPTSTDLHVPAALGYFTLLTVALWIHGSGAVLAGDARRGLAAIWLGILHLLQWVLWAAGLRIGDGLAVPEIVGTVILFAWLVRTTKWVRRHRR